MSLTHTPSTSPRDLCRAVVYPNCRLGFCIRSRRCQFKGKTTVAGFLLCGTHARTATRRYGYGVTVVADPEVSKFQADPDELPETIRESA